MWVYKGVSGCVSECLCHGALAFLRPLRAPSLQVLSRSGLIWNPVPLVRGSTRWYVLVHTSTSSSGYEAVREMSKLYIPVHTGTYGHMTFLWQYILVCTGMYFSVRGGTSKYKEVHGGTRNSTRRYETVCTGMYWYVLIQGLRFNPARVCCPAAGFAAAILPGR